MDVTSWDSSTCCHPAPYFWVQSSPQASRAPFPPPPPACPQSHSPPPTLHSPLTWSRHQASPGRRIQHLSVYRQGRLLYSWLSQTEPSLTSVFTCSSILSYLFSPLVKCIYFIFSLLFPSSYSLGEGMLNPRRFPPPCWDTIGSVTFFFPLCLLMLLGFRKERFGHLKSPYNILWFCLCPACWFCNKLLTIKELSFIIYI